ncbi:MAG: DUF1990 domain-containing protein [Proteobacteria bacterium]|nr:DUF1990 domain-containing protein [Pseudomonadota bacterium]
MFLLRKPDDRRLRQIMDGYQHDQPSYSEVGQTRGQLPQGYQIDHHRVQLGVTRETFERARQALFNWQMFRLNWLEPCWPRQPVKEGVLVGTLARIFGLWTVNVCRVVYVVEESGDVEKFGFAYGTLPGHVECGEERFTVEWHRDDDSVWYDILAFSKPGHILTRLGYPMARRLQKRFAVDSMQAMVRAVQRDQQHRG